MKKFTLFFLVCASAALFIHNSSNIKIKKVKSRLYSYVNSNYKPIISIKTMNGLKGPYEKGIITPVRDALEDRYKVVFAGNDKDRYDIIYNNAYWGEHKEELEVLKKDQAIKMFYTPEAVLPNLNDYDLVLGFDRITHSNYVRFPYYQLIWRHKLSEENIKGNMRAELGTCKPKKEVFACFLVTNGYSKMDWLGKEVDTDGVRARDSLFQKLSEYKKVESGGKHLNNIGRIVPHGETQEWLGRCKFIIAYENQSYDGYITEKVFQAYFAGSIPLYYSSQSAAQDINKEAVIFGPDFANEAKLIEYIKKVDQDDELYCKIWNQNLVTDTEIAYKNVNAKVKDKVLDIIDKKLKK